MIQIVPGDGLDIATSEAEGCCEIEEGSRGDGTGSWQFCASCEWQTQPGSLELLFLSTS